MSTTDVSLAEYFRRNKVVAGFDDTGKSLYTTVRELVENALDSTESAGVLPVIEMQIESVDNREYSTLIGLNEESRVTKYSPRKIRKTQSSRKHINCGDDIAFYRVICKDNGEGISDNDIPNLFGRVFASTKLGMKQTRGQYGLGIKMAFIWSKISTGLPVEITSSMKGQMNISYNKLDIDLRGNTPKIISHEIRENKEHWHGAKIEVVIQGNLRESYGMIMNYMGQSALINPYAHFVFEFVSNDRSSKQTFESTTKEMPAIPIETKYHPSAVHLDIIISLIAKTSRPLLLQFLQDEFVNIGEEQARHIISILGERNSIFTVATPVKELNDFQIGLILDTFHIFRFSDPSGDCLSPVGLNNLYAGIKAVLHPDKLATSSESAKVYEGHPFIVEAGVSLGGGAKRGLNIYRFANRIPLLLEDRGDVVSMVAKKTIKWDRYLIDKKAHKIGVFVSIVSTYIPFKLTGKEYIGSNTKEFASAIETCLKCCCTKLKQQLLEEKQASEQKETEKYVDGAAAKLYDILEMTLKLQGENPNMDIDDEMKELLEEVSSKNLTKESLREMLSKNVRNHWVPNK